ncbi:Holliday junction branch migration DNA helicase RuvB, partial [Mycoplasma hyorhinis]
RIRDFAIVEDTKTISKDIIDKTFNGIGIFLNGLNLQNIEYLNLLANVFKRKTVSLDVICGIMKETKENIINNIEPILLQLELIEKTPRGRKITQKGLDYLISIKK